MTESMRQAASVAEKARLLEELLEAHGGLRPEAEQRASRLLGTVDADAIDRASDRRAHRLGPGTAERSRRIPAGHGLHSRNPGGPRHPRRDTCRDHGRDDTILAYADDYPENEAAWVAQRLAKLGIGLTPHDLALVP
jgi:hypothetical protein